MIDPFTVLVDDRTAADLAAECRQQERDRQAADYAAFVADMVDLEDILEGERLELLAADEWRQAGWPVLLQAKGE